MRERHMDASGDNSFEQACQGLERISRLKESNLLEDAEYQELRALLLAQMKRFVSPAETSHTTGPQLTLPPTPSVAYGQLHAAIVEVIEERYKGAKGQAKQRIFRALADMADKQALYPGDSYEL